MIYRQGDVLIERVSNPGDGPAVAPCNDGGYLLAEGELTGHHHSIYGEGVTMFRDDALARDFGDGYVGTLSVPESGAEVRHQEHATISLPEGAYRATRQREFNAGEEHIHPD